MIIIERKESGVSGKFCDGFTLELDLDGDIDFNYGNNSGIIINRAQMAELLPILTHYVQTGELPE